MSLDASAHWLVHVPESTDGTALIPSAHQARATPLKRSAAESFIEDSLADPRKRQHLQAPALSSTPTVLAQVHPAADVSVYEASTPADDILGEVDLAALDHQGKSVPARLDVGTPSLSSNAFNTSSLSVFSARQASGPRTKNHVRAPQVGAASVTKVLLGTEILPTPAHGSTINAPLQPAPEDISADPYGSRLASDPRSTPTVDMDDYTRAITSCAGLEQQIRALQGQLAAKTEECEQTRQKVPQLLADIVTAGQEIRLSDRLYVRASEDLQRRERMIAALERKIAATEGSKDALFVQIDALNRELVYYAPPDYDWRRRFRGPTKAR